MSGLELDPGLAASLRKIERRVLADVPLGSRTVTIISVTVLVLACASIAAWITTDADGVRTVLGRVAIGFGAAAVLVSLVAVTLRRFGWCLVAAAISALGVPMSVLGYWSTQTGLRVTSVGLLIAAVSHLVLVINWLQCVRPPTPGPLRGADDSR